jgi:hypothetical protein
VTTEGGPSPGPRRTSLATASIVGANLATLALALYQGWALGSLLWPYWLQSIVIGFFARRRLLALRRFSTEGFTINDQAVPPNDATKRSTANFFALHYGFFHVGYAVFLLVLAPPRTADLPWLGLAGVLFAFSHARSFAEHVARDLAGRANIGTLMFLPYARIVPMHLVIVLGAVWLKKASGWGLLLFVALKTAADVLMHRYEHRRFEKGGPAASFSIKT